MSACRCETDKIFQSSWTVQNFDRLQEKKVMNQRWASPNTPYRNKRIFAVSYDLFIQISSRLSSPNKRK